MNVPWQVFFSIHITKVNLNKPLPYPITAAHATEITISLNRVSNLQRNSGCNLPHPIFQTILTETVRHEIIFVNQLQKIVVTYVDGQEAQASWKTCILFLEVMWEDVQGCVCCRDVFKLNLHSENGRVFFRRDSLVMGFCTIFISNCS